MASYTIYVCPKGHVHDDCSREFEGWFCLTEGCDSWTEPYVPRSVADELAAQGEATRNALHEACLKIGSTEGFRETFEAINAALAKYREAVSDG